MCTRALYECMGLSNISPLQCKQFATLLRMVSCICELPVWWCVWVRVSACICLYECRQCGGACGCVYLRVCVCMSVCASVVVRMCHGYVNGYQCSAPASFSLYLFRHLQFTFIRALTAEASLKDATLSSTAFSRQDARLHTQASTHSHLCTHAYKRTQPDMHH